MNITSPILCMDMQLLCEFTISFCKCFTGMSSTLPVKTTIKEWQKYVESCNAEIYDTPWYMNACCRLPATINRKNILTLPWWSSLVLGMVLPKEHLCHLHQLWEAGLLYNFMCADPCLSHFQPPHRWIAFTRLWSVTKPWPRSFGTTCWLRATRKQAHLTLRLLSSAQITQHSFTLTDSKGNSLILRGKKNWTEWMFCVAF